MNKHFHRFFCRLPFAWKDGSLLLISWLFPFTDASFPEVPGLPCFVAERRENLLHQEQKLTIYGVWTREISPKTFFFQMFMLDSGLLIRCMVFSMF